MKLRDSIPMAAIAAIAAFATVAVPLAVAGESSHVAPIRITSQKITLPFGDQKFEGGGAADEANTRCLICHSRGMVYTQPPMAESAWKAEVEKMASVYGCPLREDRKDALVQYLYEVNQARAKSSAH